MPNYYPLLHACSIAAFRWIACLLLLSPLATLQAQEVYLSRYVSGKHLNRNDINHRIEIFNSSRSQAQDLSGYILVTRQYILRLPQGSGTRLAPLTSLRLGEIATRNDLDIEFMGQKDFLVRIPKGNEAGDYVILFDRNMRIVDAFFFGKSRKVGFLPSQDVLVTYGQEKIPINIPDETDSRWTFLQKLPTADEAFVKAGGSWQVTNRNRNDVPATEFRFMQAKYVDGIVTVKWKSLFEQDCFFHYVERATGNEDFVMLERISGQVNRNQPFDYKFYDNEVKKDQQYRYRIRNVDKFGNTIYSQVVEALTEENPGGFTMDHFFVTEQAGHDLNVRFSAKETQRVKVKIMDEEFREVAILFYDVIEKDAQNLIKYNEQLPVGKYYLIADTDNRRYYEDFIVE
jgi:hypothetical protein